MLTLQNVQYHHSNKELLFDNVGLTINDYTKHALVGNNGVGKSTLLRIMAGILQPSAGIVYAGSAPYYVPQHFGQFNELTIAHALNVHDKLNALHHVLNGQVTETNLAVLNDDWTIEERCREALAYWGIEALDLKGKMETLSSGQKTKVFLAGVFIHQPRIVLLDEPTNHLDAAARELLYDFIRSARHALMVVSHDRQLLNLVDIVYELSSSGIAMYGGNYDFYAAQKLLERNAVSEDVKNKEKALRKAKEVEREITERQQRLDARAKKKREKGGLPPILMNAARSDAENNKARLKGVHAGKVEAMAQELDALRKSLPEADKMRFGFDNSRLHKGKVLIRATDLNFGYDDGLLWKQPLSFEIRSGERIAIKGLNGSGKTSLIKILLGQLQLKQGSIYRAESRTVYVDQEYSLLNNELTVYQQAQQFNTTALQEHEVKIMLTRFLFTKDDWDKPCAALSGGEKMRLMLCCLTITVHAPDIIVLDEPTNNLDIQNIEILTAAVNEYEGTLIVVSHDREFLEEVNVVRVIEL
ncbi:MAG TPA: ABC-F family ATP-binding cassette domain-containing protein [Chitinophagaceae bacterium]|nr:ABC-F family ATP-binding cassette domain-containing protein [Chitinophagaceae bacterium]